MTSIQLSYRLYQGAVLEWLAGLNSRHLRLNLPLVAAFVAGLWTQGRASGHAIAKGGALAHDAFTRLLNGQSLRSVLQMAALTLVENVGGYLIVDDVAWTNGRGLVVPLMFRFWKRPEWRAPEKGKKHSYFAFDGSRHQTKQELAVEMLDWAYQRGRSETTASALISDRPIALATAPVPAKVRHIKLERKRRRQKFHPIRRSDRAA